MSQNPFALLFQDNNSSSVKPDVKTQAKEKQDINDILEEIFLFTLESNHEGDTTKAPRVYLADFHSQLNQTWLDLECLAQAVCERIMLNDPKQFLTGKGHNEAAEGARIRYLVQCFIRFRGCKQRIINGELKEKCQNAIVKNSVLVLQQPELFPDNVDLNTLYNLFLEYREKDIGSFSEFINLIAADIAPSDEGKSISEIFSPMLNICHRDLKRIDAIGHPDIMKHLELLELFVSDSNLATVFLDHLFSMIRKIGSNVPGSAYAENAFGALLSIGCIPTALLPGQHYHFFDKPSRMSRQEQESIEGNIHRFMDTLQDRMYTIVYKILKVNLSCKRQFLKWIGECIFANKGRQQTWTQLQGPLNMLQPQYVNHAFFLNLGAIMLRLCQPFANPSSPKLDSINVDYCLFSTKDLNRREDVNCVGLKDETCLQPKSDDFKYPEGKEPMNFITECFFLTHQILRVGFYAVNENLIALNQDMHRMQGTFNDIRAQGGENTERGKKIYEFMESKMTTYLCVKAAMCHPSSLESNLQLQIATSYFLCKLKDNEVVLSTIPEFLAQNVVELIIAIHRFKIDNINSPLNSNHLLSFIFDFMAYPSRLRNPHSRANMAEALESFIPNLDPDQREFNSTIDFDKHPRNNELIESIIAVFVSIEETGMGVEFEQKFTYRRPMYKILKYALAIEKHRQEAVKLSNVALRIVEAQDPPLFLRFINLLVNDAIFLLDEALGFMKEIKSLEEKKDSPEWANMNPDEKRELQQTLNTSGRLARFHNVMASATIDALQALTKCAPRIFTHNIMKDRISAMLNYFLLNLVGSKRKQFKTKDLSAYEFKPSEILIDICRIYLNLSQSEEFCLAVIKDERSFSVNLFQEAEATLKRIGPCTAETEQFSEMTRKILAQNTNIDDDESIVNEAPEEFLDPIMGTLMTDPVLLPTSGNIVDKTTIARHILSDQTDPFNRLPLSMKMLEPQADLKERIENWKANFKKENK
ncbi:DgyrCDS6107 [Dimorphilus gyrociliatus]|uniref:Ubiquitin conjugation factor E4 A n=1 Tax=Dimorphilus gyrociliatus TaxID=2664684 RepID=A0A7I8VNM4_9ANNE|nr:DgyrCDS6107 [Dimorphilus gyrociliatus]